MEENKLLNDKPRVNPQHKWPPQVRDADIHQAATRLGELDADSELMNKFLVISPHQNGQIKDKQVKVCECCGYIAVFPDEGIDINTPVKEIQTLGTSTNLFFAYIKWNAFFLIFCSFHLLGFFIFGIYAIATNALLIFDVPCSKNFPSVDCYFAMFGMAGKTQITKQTNDKELLQNTITENGKLYLRIQAWLGLALVILMQFLLIYIRKKYKQIQIKNDQKFISASDFTAILSNLPRELDYGQAHITKCIQNWWEQIIQLKHLNQRNSQLNIVKVNLAYDIYQYSQTLKRKIEIVKEFRRINFFKAQFANKQNISIQEVPEDVLPEDITLQKIQEFKEIISDLDQEIKIMADIADKGDEGVRRSFYAFVTFQTRHQLNLFLSYSRRSAFQKWVSDPIRRCFNCSKRQDALIFYDEQLDQRVIKIIQTRRAPQPQDVLWQNCGVPQNIVLRNKVITLLITLICLGAMAGIIVGLTILQFRQSNDNQSSSTFNLIISLVISLVISLINVIILVIIDFLVTFQKHITITNMHQSLAFKSTLAQLVGCIVIIIITGLYIKFNVFFAGGSSDDVFMFGLVNVAVPGAVAFFGDVGWLKGIVFKWWYQKQIQQQKCLLSQKQLNQVWQGSQHDISNDYVTICKIVLFCSFFCPLQPLVLAMGPLGLFIFYWVKKYLLYNRYVKPYPGGSNLNSTMMQLIQNSPFVFAMGSITMEWFAIQDNSSLNVRQANILIANLITISFASIKFFIPLQTIFQFIYDEQILNENNMPYHQSKFFFPADYDRLNPLTKQKAILDWCGQLKNKGFDQQAQQQKQINQAQKQQKLLITKNIKEIKEVFIPTKHPQNNRNNNPFIPNPQPPIQNPIPNNNNPNFRPPNYNPQYNPQMNNYNNRVPQQMYRPQYQPPIRNMQQQFRPPNMNNNPALQHAMQARQMKMAMMNNRGGSLNMFRI